MLKSVRQRTSDEGGFTLIELLVVILIIGILAAIAIPAFLSQKSKAYDSSAKTLAQTAQTAMESWGTENNGYTGGTAAKLKEIEPSINTSNTKEAQLLETTGIAANSYKVIAKAASTEDEYSIERTTEGNLVRLCKAPSGGTGCPGHTASSSW
jgi:type IV pilus assembly protein PilA